MGLAFWLFVPICVLAVVVGVVDSTTAQSVLVGVQITLLGVQVYALLRNIRKGR